MDLRILEDLITNSTVEKPTTCLCKTILSPCPSTSTMNSCPVIALLCLDDPTWILLGYSEVDNDVVDRLTNESVVE